MSLYPDHRSAVLPALSAAQKVHGWLSEEAILQVASVMRVTPAYLESVASFYDMLELEPVGRQTIYVCTNISCQLRGAHDLLEAFSEATGSPVNGSSPDGQFHLRAFECLGACDIAPMASIEGHYRGPLTKEDARQARRPPPRRRHAAEVLPERRFVGDYGRRLARGGRLDERGDPLHAHRRAGSSADSTSTSESVATAALRKALTEMDQDQVLKELEASGLRGRGGAGFSMGKKASFLPHGDTEKYLCCNADESEPGTFKDRELMHKNPHQLVEGVLIGAFAAGAQHAFIYIRGEYEAEADILDAAVERGLRARLRGRAHPRLGLLVQPRRPPRRGRLHLRRGDGAARLARGQARQPAPQASLPGEPGPLPGADVDQQRRDALQHVPHHRQRRRLVPELRHREVARHEGRLRLRERAAARQLRGRARASPRARSSTTSPAAPTRARA